MKAIEHNYAPEQPLRLSTHEIATLLILRHAPVDPIALSPDMIALRENELGHLVESEQGQTKFAIAVKGNAALRVLGTG